MRSRPILSFILLLCTAYAASTSAYADEAASYWAEQALEAPETTSSAALAFTAFALVATLVLRLAGARPRRHEHPEFDSETLVLPHPHRQPSRR